MIKHLIKTVFCLLLVIVVAAGSLDATNKRKPDDSDIPSLLDLGSAFPHFTARVPEPYDLVPRSGPLLENEVYMVCATPEQLLAVFADPDELSMITHLMAPLCEELHNIAMSSLNRLKTLTVVIPEEHIVMFDFAKLRKRLPKGIIIMLTGYVGGPEDPCSLADV
ncbi:hypothetical protein FJ365_04540 [Candidatus Dependentiae bacterium]|nr:hypothetical protein [Candidatus Dependentiae bacterium]